MTAGAEHKSFPSTEDRTHNGFEIRRTPTGALELKIWGRFPPGWAGVMSAGVSQKGFSIMRGSAKKTQATWTALFEMDASGCSIALDTIDFVSLALHESRSTQTQAISLENFTLRDQEGPDGALLLEVRAPDQLGFLGALLNRLAFLFLFPEEMRIETLKGKAVDSFRLKGIGGSPPSPTARAALERSLRDLITP